QRLGCQKACVLPENPASYRVVRTKSYLFNKAPMTVLMLCMKQFMSKAQNEAPAWFAGLPGK
ncbi:hypothetical protein, partial [Klebsiella pneumoniae]|uniref:hypothetical protein n=1 Tax=Klebsiella pneumoniae TaxID=573 RepID=UPI001C7057D4